MTDLPSVAFHVGAHKTATTHLQRSLAEARGPLAARGVRLWLPADLRGDNPTLPQALGLPHFRKDLPPVQNVAEVAAGYLAGAERVVFSEENFIGTLGNRWGKIDLPVHARAAPRLTALSDTLAPEGIEVFLAIRKPTAFLNSAFCQAVLGGRPIPQRKFFAKNPVEGIDWPDLAGRIAGARGVRHLTVWRYEDYRPLFGAICAGLVGPAAAGAVRPVEGLVHTSLSATAVRKLTGWSPLKRSADDPQALREAYPVGPEHAPFDHFSAADHDRAGALYDRQCDLIARMPGVTFLRPDTQG